MKRFGLLWKFALFCRFPNLIYVCLCPVMSATAAAILAIAVTIKMSMVAGQPNVRLINSTPMNPPRSKLRKGWEVRRIMAT